MQYWKGELSFSAACVRFGWMCSQSGGRYRTRREGGSGDSAGSATFHPLLSSVSAFIHHLIHASVSTLVSPSAGSTSVMPS